MRQSPKITLFLAFVVLIGQFGWTWGQNTLQRYYTSYRNTCKEICDKHGLDYFWCTTEDGWDYCSISDYTDYKGVECRDDHPCGNYGKSYSWCYNKAGSWGYCGSLSNLAKPTTLSYISAKRQSVCRNECLYDEKKKYFWCDTDKGQDYCSPLPDVTYKNEPCQSNHFCGEHGYDYTWCWTKSGYDYCGVISPGECRYSFSGDGSNFKILFCTQWNRGTQLETRFHTEPEPKDLADGSPWKNELTSLISRWRNVYLADVQKSGVISTENLRVDLQGVVIKEELKYYQVEIQVNGIKCPVTGRNMIVARVMVPVQNAVLSRFVRIAFAESFRRRAKISLKQTAIQSKETYSRRG